MCIDCGGEITSPGFIRSPVSFSEDEEADAYPDEANCTWIIRAPPDQVVQLAYVSLRSFMPNEFTILLFIFIEDLFSVLLNSN